MIVRLFYYAFIGLSLLVTANAQTCDFPACHPLQQQREDVLKQIRDIQNSPDYLQGKNSPHPGRPEPEALNEVKALQHKLLTINQAITGCILKNGGKPDLPVTWDVRHVEFWTADIGGFYVVNIPVNLLFRFPCHSDVALPVPFVIDDKHATAKVSGGAGTFSGTYDINFDAVFTLDMTITVTPKNIIWPIPSRLVVHLTGFVYWTPEITALDLEGDGTYEGGSLDGKQEHVVFRGHLSRKP